MVKSVPDILARIIDDKKNELKRREPGIEQRAEALIETRGMSGFVVLAPSHGRVHPTGRPYAVLAGSVATIATVTPEEREALFALARTVGWISQWQEMIADPHQKIGRPRQLYTGPTQRDFVPIDKRG